ncbi:MAG: DNA packaging protein [Cupriavidus sp.]|nr:DNA packaging protein [Cupriavidus sp.]
MTQRLLHYHPYPKQVDFHAAGLHYRERLFSAGNQLGKTMAGAAEVAMHLTGRYPDWWGGRRLNGPNIWLAGSESTELTRDGVQRLLVGPPAQEEDWGTGFIPKDAIVDINRKQGVANALDSVVVKHVSRGNSTIYFKAYEQGRGKWQANTVDGVWFDEEPPEDVYSEGITRTNATRGMVFLTFTPLKGMSSVVKRFLNERNPDRAHIRMTIHDAAHFTPEERQRIIDSYPDHEKEARTEGIPMLGSGRIFPVADSQILIDPFPVPNYWPRIGGMDFGYDHPFAAVEMAWDRDQDVLYVLREYRESKKTPPHHAVTIRKWGLGLPWAWPHDGLQHDKGSGEQLAKQYKKEGLRLTLEKATFGDGSNGLEAGVFEMLERMQSGRWKVVRGMCPGWMEEFRMYHREEGKVMKVDDDLLCASRYAMMMRRHAKIPSQMGGNGAMGRDMVAAGVGEVVW